MAGHPAIWAASTLGCTARDATGAWQSFRHLVHLPPLHAPELPQPAGVTAPWTGYGRYSASWAATPAHSITLPTTYSAQKACTERRLRDASNTYSESSSGPLLILNHRFSDSACPSTGFTPDPRLPPPSCPPYHTGRTEMAREALATIASPARGTFCFRGIFGGITNPPKL